MDVKHLLNDKSLKAREKMDRLEAALRDKSLSLDELLSLAPALKDAQLALLLSAVEAVTQKQPEMASHELLEFVQGLINAQSDSLKRETSRIVGNIAAQFPEHLDAAVAALLKNYTAEGTVVRWSAAYALARILLLPAYAHSALFTELEKICEKEENGGVRNIYVKALKKAARLPRLAE